MTPVWQHRTYVRNSFLSSLTCPGRWTCACLSGPALLLLSVSLPAAGVQTCRSGVWQELHSNLPFLAKHFSHQTRDLLSFTMATVICAYSCSDQPSHILAPLTWSSGLCIFCVSCLPVLGSHKCPAWTSSSVPEQAFGAGVMVVSTPC